MGRSNPMTRRGVLKKGAMAIASSVGVTAMANPTSALHSQTLTFELESDNDEGTFRGNLHGVAGVNKSDNVNILQDYTGEDPSGIWFEVTLKDNAWPWTSTTAELQWDYNHSADDNLYCDNNDWVTEIEMYHNGNEVWPTIDAPYEDYYG